MEEMNQPSPVSFTWSQAWLQAVLHPSPATFDKLIKDPAATPRRAYKWMFFTTMIIIAVAGALLFFQDSASQLALMQYFLPPGPWIIVVWILLIPAGGLLSVLGLMIEARVFQWIASWQGGSGSYAQLVYALAAFEIPLGVVASVVGAIPFIGVVSWLITFYRLLLDVIAIKAVNHFGWGKAVLSIFPPVLICWVLSMILVVGFFIMLFPHGIG